MRARAQLWDATIEVACDDGVVAVAGEGITFLDDCDGVLTAKTSRSQAVFRSRTRRMRSSIRVVVVVVFLGVSGGFVGSIGIHALREAERVLPQSSVGGQRVTPLRARV